MGANEQKAAVTPEKDNSGWYGLLVIALAVGGYFGYRAMSGSPAPQGAPQAKEDVEKRERVNKTNAIRERIAHHKFFDPLILATWKAESKSFLDSLPSLDKVVDHVEYWRARRSPSEIASILANREAIASELAIEDRKSYLMRRYMMGVARKALGQSPRSMEEGWDQLIFLMKTELLLPEADARHYARAQHYGE